MFWLGVIFDLSKFLVVAVIILLFFGTLYFIYEYKIDIHWFVML